MHRGLTQCSPSTHPVLPGALAPTAACVHSPDSVAQVRVGRVEAQGAAAAAAKEVSRLEAEVTSGAALLAAHQERAAAEQRGRDEVRPRAPPTAPPFSSVPFARFECSSRVPCCLPEFRIPPTLPFTFTPSALSPIHYVVVLSSACHQTASR